MPEDLASENEDDFIMGWILLVHLIWVTQTWLFEAAGRAEIGLN